MTSASGPQAAAARAAAAVFARRGETVSVDLAGVAVELQAIRVGASEETEFGGTTAATETVRLRMLAAEIAPDGLASALISRGDQITLADGEIRVVQGVLEWADNLRVTLWVDTAPAP